MKILHTADWHIGQLFYEYDRTYEHQQFLDWLVTTLQEEQVDVLLVSGDVFDLSNPSAAAIRMFYSFLNKAAKANPALQIIITAGNHDSASRLESPKPLLESSNIHIVGIVEKDAAGNIDYEKLVIPLKDKDHHIQAWCLAIPFLRIGDYPVIADAENPYAEGIEALYTAAYDYACQRKTNEQGIIAMGHLHTQKAITSDMDKVERQIMGGVESIAASAFPAGISYVALGHIHKAQRIGGQEHIRYSGSPLPMSFSEINYKHQVIVFELNGTTISQSTAIEIPVTVALQQVPAVHSPLSAVLAALAQLPAADENSGLAPYLEVRVLEEGPEPARRFKIESALAGKHVRLARIDVRYHSSSTNGDQTSIVAADELSNLQPLDVFSKVYQSRYNTAVPEKLLQLFHQVTQEVTQTL
ncbi:exonuclease SbcCD subunit D [Chitinophaga nivalis]|uniref:Nuclease SbcCD subunit D n=1 Tax=Chitinophaga nivalis TaxID=2991709 RepID=A0ABT3II84_9BACT|nr:exonuclease SbcCD subunit D C-terminal domain-containing protein [Chitinophaga nivalis]MCW3466638.1 exonuclease SbcCD subunit D C-terminal domain-containing protein [Chitinophaga nivalis]MCW3483671.1 exonuclease SbcCD subunit D C-terminal domain-containing protein [Chitinophaga nivalis]